MREHVSTGIARGLPRWLIIRRHILRNAAVPVLTASGLTVAGLVAGSVVVESAFAVDGLGSLLVKCGGQGLCTGDCHRRHHRDGLRDRDDPHRRRADSPRSEVARGRDSRMTALTARGGKRISFRLRRRDPLLVVLLAMCGFLVGIAAFGGILAPYDPNATDILASGQGPSAAHLLGTDAIGRDVLSRLLVGARLSFAGPGLIMLVSVTLGTALALASAWWGGTFDSVTSRALNVLFAIPGILIAVLAVAVFGGGFWSPVIALSVVYIPYVARVVRSAAVQERSRAYVEAAQLAGISSWRINVFHILRNVMPIVFAQATFGFGAALIDFGAISFLGLGVQAPQAEWGLMVSEGRSEILNGDLQVSLSAGIVIVITVVAFNVLGERLTSRMGTLR